MTQEAALGRLLGAAASGPFAAAAASGQASSRHGVAVATAAASQHSLHGTTASTARAGTPQQQQLLAMAGACHRGGGQQLATSRTRVRHFSHERQTANEHGCPFSRFFPRPAQVQLMCQQGANTVVRCWLGAWPPSPPCDSCAGAQWRSHPTSGPVVAAASMRQHSRLAGGRRNSSSGAGAGARCSAALWHARWRPCWMSAPLAASCSSSCGDQGSSRRRVGRETTQTLLAATAPAAAAAAAATASRQYLKSQQQQPQASSCLLAPP